MAAQGSLPKMQIGLLSPPKMLLWPGVPGPDWPAQALPIKCVLAHARRVTPALLTLLLGLVGTFLLQISLPDLEIMIRFFDPDYQLLLLSSLS